MPEVSQREKLKKLLEEKAASVGTSPANRLTPGQLRLWEMERCALAPNIHVFSIAYYLSGPLDVERLERAIAFVASQHPELHSRVVENNAEPFFESCVPPNLIRIESAGDADALRATLRREAAVPIDPKSTAPWRCVLVRRSAQEHVLLLCFHHIIADRWSVAVLIEQLGAAYTALEQGKEPSRQTQPAAAPDESDDAGLDYWRSVFQSTVETLRLPLANDPNGFGDYAGDCLEAEIRAKTVNLLKELTRAYSITLFPILLSAFAVMLRAHTAQTELLICTPMTGRTRSSVRNAVG
jgi:arthrofactin-type cyclic lipopeptide synthetase C